MQINLSSIDREQFMVHPHVIAGETCYLVQPQHIGAKFNQENKIFRSSIWNSEGRLVSAAMPKFTNWLENPDNFPVPTNLNGCKLLAKIDGSLLCCSYYKGQQILRTRGTTDASKLDNGFELEIFRKKYSDFFDNFKDESCSYLWEWTSPLQKIVIDYGTEPEIRLIGKIYHHDYSLERQEVLDEVAALFNFKRPEYYYFDTILEMLKAVEAFKGKEGICLYSNNDQNIHKIKGLEYIARHKFKSQANIETVIDLFCELGCPDFQTFQKTIIDKFDFECYEYVQGYVSSVCDAYKEVIKIKESLQKAVDGVGRWSLRKQQALELKSKFGDSSRLSMAFMLLDNKPLGVEQNKKLIYQVLKK